MKKFAVCLMVLCSAFLLVGCGNNMLKLVKENLSEYTKIYYYGEGQEFYGTLSVGEREENYFMDGVSGDVVSFALLSIGLKSGNGSSLIKAIISIDGEAQERELELNPLNNLYMIDLEISLTGNEEISVSYNNNNVSFENLSKNFIIDFSQAIEIAVDALQDKLSESKSYNNLKAECYLRVLDKNANNLEGTFWCFTVLNAKNENFSVVISTQDGTILAKTA